MKEGEAVAVGPEEEVLPKTVQNALLEHGGHLPSPDTDMVCPPWALKRHQGHLVTSSVIDLLVEPRGIEPLTS
jgi:hypothetical protein